MTYDLYLNLCRFVIYYHLRFYLYSLKLVFFMFLHTIFFTLFACSDDKEEITEQDSINTTEPTTEPSDDTTEPIDEEICVNDEDFFEDDVWAKALSPVCYSCHNAQGAANSSDLVLVSNAQPNYLETNRERFGYVASLSIDGQSLVLRKPLGMDGHGGGQVITEDSDAFQAITGFVERLENPIEFCEGDIEAEKENHLVMASPTNTLRKITLQFFGKLPSPEHYRKVKNGGEHALQQVLWELLQGDAVGYGENTEELFLERMKEIWNDQLLTNRYLSGTSAIQIVDYDMFYSLYWYDGGYDNYNSIRNLTNDAIAQEPLEIMAEVVRKDMPWSEILTADWTMVNGYSAMSYGVTTTAPTYGNPQDEMFYQAQLDGYRHVGILSTPTFLNRYPTTATNRNRHRSKIIFDYFLHTDILALADRPIDASASSVHNPTMNDPQCNVCHSVMEPVSGAFQNWDEDGHYNPRDEGWYPEMYPPGFEGEDIDISERDNALRWLAERIVEDPRFAQASIKNLFEGVTGFPVLRQYELQEDSIEMDAWEKQSTFLEEMTQKFIDSELNYKEAIIHIWMSSYFRAISEDGATDDELLFAGTAKLLTPEELNRKIEAVLGIPWRNNAGSTDHLLDRYGLLYGGIDSDDVTDRLTEPNGIMAAVAIRMANDMSCKTVANDFVLPMEQRRLFPFVEPTYTAYTAEGFDVPQVQEKIKQNIQYLFFRILGQDLDLNDPEVLSAYDLYVDIQQTGQALIDAEEESQYIQWSCRGREEFWTGYDYPSEMTVAKDSNYSIRSWRAIIAYMLSDYHFLYE